jgi:hypothetical protein
MMLSPVEQGPDHLTGMRHTITHVVMRRTRSAFAKVGRSVTPEHAYAKLVPYHHGGGHGGVIVLARDLRSLQAVSPLKT